MSQLSALNSRRKAPSPVPTVPFEAKAPFFLETILAIITANTFWLGIKTCSSSAGCNSSSSSQGPTTTFRLVSVLGEKVQQDKSSPKLPRQAREHHTEMQAPAFTESLICIVLARTCSLSLHPARGPAASAKPAEAGGQQLASVSKRRASLHTLRDLGNLAELPFTSCPHLCPSLKGAWLAEPSSAPPPHPGHKRAVSSKATTKRSLSAWVQEEASCEGRKRKAGKGRTFSTEPCQQVGTVTPALTCC